MLDLNTFFFIFSLLLAVIVVIFILKTKQFYQNSKILYFLSGSFLIFLLFLTFGVFSAHRIILKMFIKEKEYKWFLINRNGQTIGKLPDTIRFNIKYKKVGSCRSYMGAYDNCFYGEAFSEMVYDSTSGKFIKEKKLRDLTFEKYQASINRTLKGFFRGLNDYQNYRIISYSEGFFLIRCYAKQNLKRSSFSPRFFYIDTLGVKYIFAKTEIKHEFFTSAAPFYNGYALVSHASCGKFYLINKNEEQVSAIYNLMYPAKEQFYTANTLSKSVLISSNNCRVIEIPHKTSFIGHFSNGLACVRNKAETVFYRDNPAFFEKEDRENLWGFVDSTGKWAITPKFYQCNDFSENMAAVIDTKSEKWGFINKSGKWIIQPTFDKATFFHNGVAAVAFEK